MKKTGLVSTFLLSTALAAGTLAAQTADSDSEKIMIVMDSSGSMWGQIEGETKRDIARKALRGVLPTLPENASTGLVAYGHREKGNCGDIEVLLPASAGSREKIADAADNLKSLGKTPLTAAVKKAAETLAIEEEKSTVILITDGIETCEADPCALGRSLEEQGIDFTAHVIGFGLSKDEGQQVACLAEETGGLFIEAQNAEDLGEALETVAVDMTTEEDPELLGEATVDAPDTVPAGSVFKVDWTGPQNPGDLVRIFTPDGERKHKYAYAFGDNAESPEKLTAPEAPGTYEVRYVTRKGSVLATDSFEVIATTATVDAPDSVAAGSVFKAEWTGPQNTGDLVRIFSTDGEKKYKYFYTSGDNAKSPDRLTAPEDEGQYLIRYVTRGGNVLAETSFEVTAVTASVNAPDDVPAGSVFMVDWTGPKNAGDLVRIFSTDGEKKYKYFYASGDNAKSPDKVTAPEGEGPYLIRYVTRGGNVLAEDRFDVTAVTASVDAPDSVPAGSEFKVEWSGPQNAGDLVRIFSADSEKRYKYAYASGNSAESPSKITAPENAGTYLVRYMTRGGNELAKDSFVVTAVSATVDAPSRVTAGEKFKFEWTGPQNAGDIIRIFSVDGERKYKHAYASGGSAKSPEELIAPNEPGTYEIRYMTRGGKILGKDTIEVR